jgi:hypothetical protein
MAKRLPPPRIVANPEEKPYCFISYSTREPHVNLLVECVKMLFLSHYGVEVTPSALESGASQRDRITELISNCTFGIVCLDGLRPNISFEYGVLHGKQKPIILLREQTARVDITGFFRDSPDLKLGPVSLDLDSQFSNVKDVNYAVWNRNSIAQTMGVLWDEFQKKKDEIKPFHKIVKPTW